MDQGWINGWGGGLEEEVVHPVELLHSCDFSVSPSPFGLDLGTFYIGLGLDNFHVYFPVFG